MNTIGPVELRCKLLEQRLLEIRDYYRFWGPSHCYEEIGKIKGDVSQLIRELIYFYNTRPKPPGMPPLPTSGNVIKKGSMG